MQESKCRRAAWGKGNGATCRYLLGVVGWGQLLGWRRSVEAKRGGEGRRLVGWARAGQGPEPKAQSRPRHVDRSSSRAVGIPEWSPRGAWGWEVETFRLDEWSMCISLASCSSAERSAQAEVL